MDGGHREISDLEITTLSFRVEHWIQNNPRERFDPDRVLEWQDISPSDPNYSTFRRFSEQYHSLAAQFFHPSVHTALEFRDKVERYMQNLGRYFQSSSWGLILGGTSTDYDKFFAGSTFENNTLLAAAIGALAAVTLTAISDYTRRGIHQATIYATTGAGIALGLLSPESSVFTTGVGAFTGMLVGVALEYLDWGYSMVDPEPNTRAELRAFKRRFIKQLNANQNYY